MKPITAETEFTPKIFVSDYRGYQPMDDQPEPICRFSPFRILGAKGERDAGHYICHDPKIYERLKKHPDNGKGFKEVKKLPTRVTTGGYIISGVATGEQPVPKKLNDEQVAMLRELGALEARFFDDKGELKASVKEEAGKQAQERVAFIKQQLEIQ